jgi:tetratricopeptide (TPR) repeat protein
MKTAAFACLFVLAVSAASFAQDAEPVAPTDPATQVRQAMDAAREFARAGKIDESLAAIREVLKNGPPVKVTFRGLLETLAGQASSNTAQMRAVTVEVALGLRELDPLWREKHFPPAKVFETLRAIVFPESRKTEVFTYSLLNSSSAAEHNAGSILAEWSVDADRTAELRKLLDASSLQKTSQTHFLTRMQIAWAERDSLQLSDELDALAATLDGTPDVGTAAAALPAISIALRDEDAAFDAIPVMERVIELLEPTGLTSFTSLEPLLRNTAWLQFEQGDSEAADRHLSTLLNLYRKINALGGDTNVSNVYKQRLAAVAGDYLRGDQLGRALDVTGEAITPPLPVDQLAGPNDGFAAVAAALNRRLIQLDAEQRYDLLRNWTLPDESGEPIRILSTFAAVDAPPAAFARALGESPRGDSFAVPEIGNITGLFCSGWELARAAGDAGYLRQLILDLEAIIESTNTAEATEETDDATQVRLRLQTDAQYLLRLARIAGARSGLDAPRLLQADDISQLAGEIAIELESVRNRPRADGSKSQPVEMRDITLAAACLTSDELRASGIELIAAVLELTGGERATFLRPLLRRAHALALLQANEGVTPSLLERPNLDLWIPASALTAAAAASGATSDIWLRHEDHILHLSGPGQDYLCFRYPLTGDFQLAVEVQESSFARIEGGLIYGGLCYASSTHEGVRVHGLERRAQIHLPTLYLTTLGRPLYQQLKLDVSPAGTVFSTNRHPVFRDPVSQTSSPWIGLRTIADHDPAFRNLRITGDPVIPREVQLVSGNTLRGWLYGYYSESSPGVVTADASINMQQALDGQGPLADAPAGNAVPVLGLQPERVQFESTFTDEIIVAPEGRQTRFRPMTVQRTVDGQVVTMTVMSPVVDPRLTKSLASFDWFAKAGVLHGRQAGVDFTSATQSRLSYFRPLQDGESLSYEFLYEAGRFEVHPAIGRLAFLMDPGGMRVHWLTTGENDWTGLAANNSLVEPLNRKTRRLPLKTGDWNEVTVSLDGDFVSLSVNGTLAYTRKLEPEVERAFSFYHDRNRSAVRVRNVVLRGDWPERLSVEQLADPAADTIAERTQRDRQFLGTVFADRHTPDSALNVHRNAMAMRPEQRFEYLRDWVLPGADHERIRIAMEFSQLHPAPPVAAMNTAVANETAEAVSETASESAGSATSRIHMGGDVVSPALDLIRVAAELGRLDQVQSRLEAHSHTDQQQRKARAALLAVIDLKNRNFETALKRLDELFNLLETEHLIGFKSHWPETTAFAVAVNYVEAHDGIRDLLTRLIVGQVRQNRSSGSDGWPRQISAYSGMLRITDLLSDLKQRNALANATGPTEFTTTKLESAADLTRFRQPPNLRQWSPVSLHVARYRGPGAAPAMWRQVPDSSGLRKTDAVSGFSRPQIQKLTNFDNDYLFFQSPLRGDYSVEAEASVFGWNEMTFSIGGRWAAAVYNRKTYRAGYLRGNYKSSSLEPRLLKPGSTFRLRADIRNGLVTTYMGGRQIHQEPLDANEPWLALRSPYRNYGIARNVRITGSPEIPETLQLTATDSLPGWIPYHLQSVGTARADWRQRGALTDGGGIVGRLKPELRGSYLESVVHYHRPMMENGHIDYEFYYHPGESNVAPVMDRLAFVLDPDHGVRIHWITDARFDHTLLDPANMSDEPEYRRGGGTQPDTSVSTSSVIGLASLKPNAWNKVSLQLTGDTVHLFLNGQEIYERPLEPENQRTFGFFHYCGQTEARVRNVTWAGDWPKQLPSLAEQELAGIGAEILNARSKELTAVFDHDFSLDGLPRNLFMVTPTNMPHTLEVKPDGVHITQGGGNGYMNFTVSPMLRITGDFDITVAFEGFVGTPEPGGKCSVLLQALFDNEAGNQSLVFHRHALPQNGGEREETFSGSKVEVDDRGTQRSYFGTTPSEAPAGRLRLSRRGSVVYYLFSENESQTFHLLHAESLTDAPIMADGLRIIAQSAFDCSTSVVFTQLTIRAEGLSGLALEDATAIVVGLNEKRAALPESFTHDFAKDSFAEDRMIQWNQKAGLSPSENGLPVVGIGKKTWSACGLAPRLVVSGDFDVSVTFDDVHLAVPVGNDYSGVLLQIELADEDNTQFYALFKRISDGKTLAQELHRRKGPDGVFQYIGLNSARLEKASRLRITRYGTELCILYATPESARDVLLSRLEIGREDIVPDGVRLMLHTGADGLESQMTWQRLNVRATKVTGVAVGK